MKYIENFCEKLKFPTLYKVYSEKHLEIIKHTLFNPETINCVE